MKNKKNLLFNKYLLLDNFNFSSAYQLTANNIVSNLLLGYLTNRAVAISRRSNSYSIIPGIYDPHYHSYRKTVGCLDWLRAAGLAEQSLGFYDRSAGGCSRSRLTKIEPTDKLLKEISLTEIKLTQKFPTALILKDRNKNLITYRHTDETRMMTKFLNVYNEFMEGHTACLDIKNGENLSEEKRKIIFSAATKNFSPLSSLFSSKYDYSNLSFTLSSNHKEVYQSGVYIRGPFPLLITNENSDQKCTFDTQCCRVFNNANFEEGGRFYSGYQNLKKEKRKELKLNGFSIVEIDYKSIHPAMLYNMEKLACPAEPYIKVEGIERKEIKKLFQILLNSDGRVQALRAGLFYLKKNPEVLKRAFNLLEENHPHISKHFYTGIGIQLQRKDSALAEGIMSHFMERNIAILTIHDSFIVPEHHQSELADVMKYYYQSEFNYQPGLSIK